MNVSMKKTAITDSSHPGAYSEILSRGGGLFFQERGLSTSWDPKTVGFIGPAPRPPWMRFYSHFSLYQAQGASCIEYEPTIPTKFMVGTEQGEFV